MPKIIFTGGGTAGHVTPNLALIEQLQEEGWEVLYVGSKAGIEARITGELLIPFRAIATGKLRRYFDWQNFIDPFRILLGFLQSLVICIGYRADVVFSKGGFVAVPLVAAAWLCRIPVIGHESDMTPGLANKLSYPFMRKICVNFPQTASLMPGSKVVVTGTPIRRSLIN
ncbi:MAG: glycosyltransferase, partial [Pseudomonadales bacterium]